MKEAKSSERFVHIPGEEPVAELRTVTPRHRLGDLPELLASLPALLPEELDSLAADLNDARDELARLTVRDPWES